MTIDRRHALAMLGMGTAASAGAAVAHPAAQVAFRHGVASGDPAADGAVIWTRVAPDDRARTSVGWTVRDETSRVIKRGAATTGADRDHTVKVVVTGLKPGREYVYQFKHGAVLSPEGRFRTLPEATDEVVFAVASCALHPGGLFNAYDAIAKLPGRLDAVIHLGDYIYEYGAGPADYGLAIGQRLNRLPDPPHEIVTLADYRRRHAQYKSDPNLQAAHARAAWITVWDDHEVTNDGWYDGAQNHQPDTEGAWAIRKANALKAYYEWMPIREPAPGRTAEMLDRSFRFGDVATLHMTETRLLARSKQLNYATDLAFDGGAPALEAFQAKRNAADRSLLGERQFGALTKALAESAKAGVTWQVLGNQVVMGRVRGPDIAKMLTAEQLAGLLASVPEEYKPRVTQSLRLFAIDLPYNLDAWDGYPAERERLYAAFKAAGAHPIVLAGDSHAFWVNDLKDAAGANVAAEFGATSITSPGFGDITTGFDIGAAFAAANDEVAFSNQSAKGFVKLTLTRTEARGELMTVSTILSPTYDPGSLGTWRVTPAAGPGVSAVMKV